jgi:DNA-binding transcriptional regulator YdaS (Cro superfamily)
MSQFMDLSTYKRTTGTTYSHIARICGVTSAMISQVAAGSHPSFELALKIEKATNGSVGRENWFPSRSPVASIVIKGASDE